MALCTFENCNKIAIFNDPGTKKGIFCKAHKNHKMINVRDKRCEMPDCQKVASYGLCNIDNFAPLSKSLIYCYKHKLPEHINLRSRTCLQKGCTKQPSFGIDYTLLKLNGEEAPYYDGGKRRALYCFEHKSSYHVNVNHKMCKYKECMRQPSYGLVGTKIALYCSKHKTSEHVNLNNTTCAFVGCNRNAYYGDKETGKKTNIMFCFEHKQEKHINLKIKNCIIENCQSLARYGNLEDKIPLVCKKHIQPNYVNLKSKLCKHTGCKKHALYGEKNYTLSSSSNTHISSSNTTSNTNISSSSSSNTNISSSSSSNTSSNINTNITSSSSNISAALINAAFINSRKKATPEYCFAHKKPHHVNLRHTTCSYNDCQRRPFYGLIGNNPILCYKHKGMEHVRLAKKYTPKKRKAEVVEESIKNNKRLCDKNSISRIMYVENDNKNGNCEKNDKNEVEKNGNCEKNDKNDNCVNEIDDDDDDSTESDLLTIVE